MAWLSQNWGVLFAVLFAISEGLALIPSIQANSVFQMIFNVLKSLKPAADSQEPKK